MIYNNYYSGSKKFYEALKNEIMPQWKKMHDFNDYRACEVCGNIARLDAHHTTTFLDMLKETCNILGINYEKGKYTTDVVYSIHEFYAVYGLMLEKHMNLRPMGVCRTCHERIHGRESQQTVFKFRDSHDCVNIVLPVLQPSEDIIEINFYNYNKKIKFSKKDFYACIIFAKHGIIKYGDKDMYLVSISEVINLGLEIEFIN